MRTSPFSLGSMAGIAARFGIALGLGLLASAFRADVQDITAKMSIETTKTKRKVKEAIGAKDAIVQMSAVNGSEQSMHRGQTRGVNVHFEYSEMPDLPDIPAPPYTAIPADQEVTFTGTGYEIQKLLQKHGDLEVAGGIHSPSMWFAVEKVHEIKVSNLTNKIMGGMAGFHGFLELINIIADATHMAHSVVEQLRETGHEQELLDRLAEQVFASEDLRPKAPSEQGWWEWYWDTPINAWVGHKSYVAEFKFKFRCRTINGNRRLVWDVTEGQEPVLVTGKHLAMLVGFFTR